MYYDPDNTTEVISSRSVSLLEQFLGRRRPPKIKSTVYQYIRPSLVNVREGMVIYINLTINLYDNYVEGLGSNSCSLICSQTRCRLRYHVLPV